MDSQTEEVFEINDFTVVTETEHLIVAIESHLHEWKLSGRRKSPIEFIGRELSEKSAQLKFMETELRLIWRHVADEDCADNSEPPTDDPDGTAHLASSIKDMVQSEFDLRDENSVFTQFGVLEHLLIRASEEDEVIDSENLATEIRGAVLVATSNADCEIPVFVQFGEDHRHLYMGTCQNKCVRTIYEGIHLQHYLRSHGAFSGILDLFKCKINYPLIDSPRIDVSVSFEYVHEIESTPGSSASSVNDSDRALLYFGGDDNCISEVKLCVTWPKLTDLTINETDTFSDLDPLSAPRWFTSVSFRSGCHMLYNSLNELLDVREANSGDYKVNFFVDYKAEDSKPAQALSALTHNHVENDVQFVNTTSNKALELRNYAQKRLKAATEKFDPVDATPPERSFKNNALNVLSQAKSAPLNSLTCRISVALVKCLLSHRRSLSRFCAVWVEFVEMLRNCWDSVEDVPGIEPDGQPDLSTSLLHQKLQMIQHCIKVKRQRHALLDEGKGVQTMLNSSSSDIFYDAEEEDPAEPSTTSPDLLAPPDQPKLPQGRSHVLDNEFLLDNPSEPIFVPQTQDRGPMTEDMVEEHTSYLTSLADAQDRTKAQLDQLISDMQAFKAANPGSRVEDFVRWHSPRDWIVEEDGQGRLSDRMAIPDNMWVESWNSARPIPVSAQVRLFNEAKEAESILHSFETLTVRALIDLILPVVFTQAGHAILMHCDPVVESMFDEKLQAFVKKLSYCTVHGTPEDYFDLHKLIPDIEVPLAKFEAVKKLFEKEIESQKLMRAPQFEPEILEQLCLSLSSASTPARILDAPNGAVALAVRQLMDKTSRLERGPLLPDDDFAPLKLPTQQRKKYILRTVCSRPGVESRRVPQRMFVSVGQKHFRVCGAFTDDITFR